MAEFDSYFIYTDFEGLDGAPDTSLQVVAHLTSTRPGRASGVVAGRPVVAAFAPVEFTTEGQRPGRYRGRLIPSAQLPNTRYRLDASGAYGTTSYYFAMPAETVTADEFAALIQRTA